MYAVGFEGRWSGFLSLELVRLDIPVVHLSLGRGRGTFHPRGGRGWSVGPPLEGVLVSLLSLSVVPVAGLARRARDGSL